MFEDVLDTRTPRRPFRWRTVALSAVAQLALASAALALHRPAPAASRPIEVAIVAPRPVRPSTPPAPPAPGPAQGASKPRPRAPLVQPKTLPGEPPSPTPEPKPEPGPVTSEDGVVGGGSEPLEEPAPAAPPSRQAPIEARLADVASVRAALERTFSYPPDARRRRWQGRVLLAFTLDADGSLLDLQVRQSSGHDVLDQAAADAIRRAAPFDPPGVPVRVVIPVSFRLY
jgi:protein TonB